VKELKEWIAMLEQVLKNEVGTDTFELTEARERRECLSNPDFGYC